VADAGLRGLHVLVTRPAHQAQGLMDIIRDAGGVPRAFPVLEITDPADTGRLLRIVQRLEEFDLAIFISPNAVHRGMQFIRAHRALPSHLRLACVGPGSARELQRLGYDNILVPRDHYDSEALLALPPLQAVAGQRIVIFRGEGGRELLGATLTARGAQVEYAECYRRRLPNADPAPLLRAWRAGEVGMVIITSGEGLANLHQMLGEAGRPLLLRTPIVVVAERTAQACRALGVHADILVAPAADDAAILQVMQAWRSRQNSL
jgi:uroporphyrinogen-III synthase